MTISTRHRSSRSAHRWLAAGLLVAAAAASLPAQAPSAVASPAPAATSPACGYAQCALGIAPVWNGLAIVQGPAGTPVSTLSFFLPRRLDAVFVGDSARTFAEHAFRTRRMAAVLTDVGGLLLAVSAIRGASSGELSGSTRAMAFAGAGAFAVSVPLQFSADGWLSRAVWWHNAQFGR